MNAMVRGEAKDSREKFEFTITPLVAGGFLLTISYSGDSDHNITGAGVWPTIGKQNKSPKIRQQDSFTGQLFHGAKIQSSLTTETENMKELVPYKEAFPAGTTVRIADRTFLENFLATWKYHHNLIPEQLAYADQKAKVKGVGAYHGGDMVYTLEDIPGLWLEQCLREP